MPLDFASVELGSVALPHKPPAQRRRADPALAIPLERHPALDDTGVVYVLCFQDEPRWIADTDSPVPLFRHYVGWTSRRLRIRLTEHGGVWLCRFLADWFPGTKADERRCKAHGRCNRCGQPLEYRLCWCGCFGPLPPGAPPVLPGHRSRWPDRSHDCWCGCGERITTKRLFVDDTHRRPYLASRAP